MDCAAAREAISTLLDGEPVGIAQDRLRSHLDACAACRAWREQAHEVTRRVRLAEAAPVPAPDDSLLEAMQTLDRRGSWWRTLALTRVALVLVALAQIVLSLPELLSGSYRDAPIHVAHEMGALDLALAVGFLAAAFRPTRAQGMRALIGCAALLLLLTGALDLIAGRTSWSDEAPHLLVLAGWLLLRRTAMLMPTGENDRLARARPLRSRLIWAARPWSVDRWTSRPSHDDPGREAPLHTIDVPEPAPKRLAEGG